MSEIPHHGELVWVTHADLRPGPNPRKSFDDAELQALADSIAAQGLLQNLVVTTPLFPDLAANGVRVLVAGERRYRAIGLLIEQQRWEEARPIPCRLVEADAGTIRALALLENLQRQDVPPIEEAEAFHQLHSMDEERWSVAHIAAAIGRTPRYVQQRIAIATKLAPEAKQMLADGKLTFTQARELVTVPAAAQALTAQEEVRSADWSMTRIRNRARAAMFDMRLAKFPTTGSALRDWYAGDVYEDDEGVTWALDRNAAIEANTAWAKEHAAEAGAQLYLDPPGYWNPDNAWSGEWRTPRAGEEEHGQRVVAVDSRTGEVSVHENLVPRGFRLPDTDGEAPAEDDDGEDIECDDDDAPVDQLPRSGSARFEQHKAWRDALEALPPAELLTRLSSMPPVAIKHVVEELINALMPFPHMHPADALALRLLGLGLALPDDCSIQAVEDDEGYNVEDCTEARRLLAELDAAPAIEEALAVIEAAAMPVACTMCSKPLPRVGCHYVMCPQKSAGVAA